MYLSEKNSDLFWLSIGWLLVFFQILVIMTGHPELGTERYAGIFLALMVGLLGLVFHRFCKKSPNSGIKSILHVCTRAFDLYAGIHRAS